MDDTLISAQTERDFFYQPDQDEYARKSLGKTK